MMKRGLALFSRIGPYGLAAATQAGTSFLVLPLLLLLIGANSYGRFALLEPLVAMLAQVLLLGAHQGMLHDICKEGVEPRSALTQTLAQAQIYIVPILAALGGAVWFWQGSSHIALLFCAALYLEAINLACLTTARAVGDAWPFFAAIATRSTAMLSAILLASHIFDRGVLDERFALAVMGTGTLCSVALLSFRILRRRSSSNGATQRADVSIQKSIRYGFPLVMAGLCQSTIALADRYILSAFVSPAALTAYVVSVKLANALNLAATPINLWWPTARFQHMKDPDGGQAFFRGAAVKIGGLYALAALLLICSAPFVLPVLGPGVNANPGIAALMVVAGFLQAFQVVLNIGLLSAGHTAKTFYIAASVAVLHVAGCFALIPTFGVYGAALMGVVSALTFALAVNWASQRVTAVRQNVRLIGFEFFVVAFAALFMAVQGSAR